MQQQGWSVILIMEDKKQIQVTPTWPHQQEAREFFHKNWYTLSQAPHIKNVALMHEGKTIVDVQQLIDEWIERNEG